MTHLLQRWFSRPPNMPTQQQLPGWGCSSDLTRPSHPHGGGESQALVPSKAGREVTEPESGPGLPASVSHRVWAGGGGPSEWESFHLGREEESLVFRVSFENLCEGMRLGKRLNGEQRPR